MTRLDLSVPTFGFVVATRAALGAASTFPAVLALRRGLKSGV